MHQVTFMDWITDFSLCNIEEHLTNWPVQLFTTLANSQYNPLSSNQINSVPFKKSFIVGNDVQNRTRMNGQKN